ncbi:podocalyxin [Hippopotamus amphibius kiboko]|uniref:podocalyxin n=1 Tax=Hippopotamus amphibius kiboko TaxID=575201 RepID=UPI002594986B|nr:podocalyxin [Hippopotamus amphibius kiboko]
MENGARMILQKLPDENRGGGGGRRGRDRSRRSRRPGRSRADTARDAAVRRSSAAWLGASARLCRSGCEEEPPERDSGVPGHGPAAGATARPPQEAPALLLPAAPTLRHVRSHLPRARRQDTMLSALVLSALLLLLRCPACAPGTPHTPAETPAVTSTSEPLQPTGTSLGSRTTSPVRRPTSSIAQWASTAPQDSSIPSPTFSVIQADVGQIRCYSPEKPNEKMLILNVSKTDISKTDICNAVASNDKLVTLLCRAAKASFNPAHDECHVQLAPFPGTQEVAVKQISILTNLLPTDVYEFLKDKRDELKEMGVSDMQFHGQGPPEEPEDRFSMPLIITIVCMASFLLLVAALYGCCHQRLSQRKDQQRLTEELQTVENGYHDNPTLEVMETSSEMQEKKVVNLNGELGDSWIVPLDNLTKDDLDEEEDTHL